MGKCCCLAKNLVNEDKRQASMLDQLAKSEVFFNPLKKKENFVRSTIATL